LHGRAFARYPRANIGGGHSLNDLPKPLPKKNSWAQANQQKRSNLDPA